MLRNMELTSPKETSLCPELCLLYFVKMLLLPSSCGQAEWLHFSLFLRVLFDGFDFFGTII